MTTISIKNVGPIKIVENLILNKVNVFMGPQSSGKSTIAKIISYCTWVEKEVCVNQSFGSFLNNGSFRDRLEAFHNINGYFKDESEIIYKSENIELSFKNNTSSIRWINRYSYKRSKIEYIPSERNLITLPAIQKVDMHNNNNRSFLFDWLSARPKYTKDNRVQILKLPVEYYFDEGANENHISSTNAKEKYDILLENASSGLQSLTPLIVVIKYITDWIYKNEQEISFEKQQRIRKVEGKLINELVLTKYFNEEFNNDDTIELIKKINELLKNNDRKVIELVNEYFKVTRNLFMTHNTQIIIEEPEQNLFPSTQRDLVYHLLNILNQSNKEHRVTLTTHSPYILYALNNCMMGYLVKDKMPEDEQNEIPSKASWINPEEVSVFQIKEGELFSIKDEETKVIGDHYFNDVMGAIMDEYYEMLNYFE